MNAAPIPEKNRATKSIQISVDKLNASCEDPKMNKPTMMIFFLPCRSDKSAENGEKMNCANEKIAIRNPSTLPATPNVPKNSGMIGIIRPMPAIAMNILNISMYKAKLFDCFSAKGNPPPYYYFVLLKHFTIEARQHLTERPPNKSTYTFKRP